MDSEISMDRLILKSAVMITSIPNLNRDIGQFAKWTVLMLCDKFVEDESLSITISNLVGGNMKIVEDYAQRKVDEAKKEFKKELVAKDEELVAKDDEFEKSKQKIVVNLDNEGYSIKDIARIADVSLDFVSKTLSK